MILQTAFRRCYTSARGWQTASGVGKEMVQKSFTNVNAGRGDAELGRGYVRRERARLRISCRLSGQCGIKTALDSESNICRSTFWSTYVSSSRRRRLNTRRKIAAQ